MKRPRVSAIITVYNAADTVQAAVRSLLAQSFSDLEVVVVDDGSSDATRARLAALKDPRLRVLQGGRRGRAPSLVRACLAARGELIANLDADDRARPRRIAAQVGFFAKHPDHGWLGTAVERRDALRGEHTLRRYPEADPEVRRQAARCIPYCHSAVMFRSALVREGLCYDPRLRFLIDFELFLRVAARCKVANLPEVLVERDVRADSFFTRRFGRFRQNLALARLNARAARAFELPLRERLSPWLRLGYPLLPVGLQRRLRGAFGLRETALDRAAGGR